MWDENPYQPQRTPGEPLAAIEARILALQRAQSEAMARFLATPQPPVWTTAQRSQAEAALFPGGYGSVTLPYYQPPVDDSDAAFLRSLGIAP